MKVKEILSASHDDQKAWVADMFPDYQAMAYEETCFAIFYPFDAERLSDYASAPDEMDTFPILAKALSNFDEARANSIRNGASFTKREADALMHMISEADTDGWVGVHSWKATCDDGEVHIVALGYSEGQGGIRLDEPSIYRSRAEAEASVKDAKLLAFI